MDHLLDEPSRSGVALQMVVDLDRFWHNRGHLAECAALIRRGLDAGGRGVSRAVRCGALNLAGQAAMFYDSHAAHSHFNESLEIARAANDDFRAATARWGLAFVSYSVGDSNGGSAAAKAAVELARALGDPVLLGECLMAFGMGSGTPSALRAVYEEALAVTRRSGDRINTAWSHNNLGNWALVEDDLDTAHHHLEQARAILHEVGAPGPISACNLGWVHLRREHHSAANDAFTQALHLSEVHQLRRDASYAILGLACTAAARHEWERAACLSGLADGELQACGASWAEPERIYRQQLLSQLECELGGGFERSYDAGRTSDRRDLIEFALDHEHLPRQGATNAR